MQRRERHAAPQHFPCNYDSLDPSVIQSAGAGAGVERGVEVRKHRVDLTGVLRCERQAQRPQAETAQVLALVEEVQLLAVCLLYTSDAADE